MAKIERREIVQEIIQGLRLDSGREKVPMEVEDKVRAVYIAGSPPKFLKFINDTGTNDSDKQIAVPVGKQWKLLYGTIRLSTTATVGNRRLRFAIRDSIGAVVYQVDAVNVQAASLIEDYSIGQFGIPDESVTGMHLIPFPVNLIMPSSFDIRIFDRITVDAAADDLVVRFVVEETDTSQQIE